MKLLKRFRWVLLLVIIAAIVRVFIFLQLTHMTPFADYFDYKQWVYTSYSLGLSKLYSIPGEHGAADINQPPGSIYILRGSYELFLQVAKTATHFFHLQPGATIWVDDALLIFFLRFPSLLADLFLGFLIYIVVKTKSSERVALFASAFYLLNPAILYNSTVWGQMDSINNVFFYLSLIFLIKKKAFPSVLFLGLSLFVKLSLLPLLPLYFLLSFFGDFFRRKTFLITVAGTTLILIIISLPISSNPLWLFDFATKASSGQSQVITVNAFNFWWLLFKPAVRINPPEISSVFFGFSLGAWGNFLFGVLYIPILLTAWKHVRKKELTTDDVYLLFALVAFATFLVLPKMHERYLYPALPLLITWIGLKNRYWILAALLSFFHFVNLYTVWNPNLFLFGKFEDAVRGRSSNWNLSLATTVLFGFFYSRLFLLFKKYFALR